MKTKKLEILVITASALFAQITFADHWNTANNPAIFNSQYEHRLNALPMDAQLPLEKTPWSDTYWPSAEGSIANRWHSKNKEGFKYHLNSRDEVKKMTAEEIAELSPAEKYDILQSRYDYPTVRAVWKRNKPSAPSWNGICHGWAPASIQHSEPKTINVTNPDGVEIQFGSSDVKAMLSYYYAWNAQLEVHQVGQRCFFPGVLSWIPSCTDTNAGAFHIVLANQIGIQKQGFIADVTRGKEVWNNPVSGYTTKVERWSSPKFGSTHGTVSRVLVTTEMVYTNEISPNWNTVAGTENFSAKVKTFKYWLELDKDGKIIGGDWASEKRPDFLWISDRAEFKGYYADIEKLLN